jgi:photosystem II stability/assembly factor-like uncharacterized protein
MLRFRLVLAFALGVLSVHAGGTPMWSELRTLKGFAVTSLAINPVNPSVLYAVSSLDGVFKTTDAGATWALISTGIAGQMLVIAIDPTSTNTLYLATSYGLYKSTNAGGTWLLLYSSYTTTAIAIDPVNPLIVYTAQFSAYLNKSTNGADFFRKTNLSSPFLLAIDPRDHNVLYSADAYGRVLRSADAGETWTVVFTPAGLILTAAITIDGSTNPSTIYAAGDYGLIKSTNGTSWSAAMTGLPSDAKVQSIAVDPVSPSKLYAGTVAHGLFKSTDAGAHWSGMAAPSSSYFCDFVIDPLTPSTLYVASKAGVFKSTDGGATWAWMNNADRPARNIMTLAVTADPTHSSLVVSTLAGAVLMSHDGGSTWSPGGLGMPGSSSAARNGSFPGGFDQIVAHPTDPNILYACSGRFAGVFKSTDAGVTWARDLTGWPDHSDTVLGAGCYAVAIDSATPDTVYAYAASGQTDALVRSTAAAGGWTTMPQPCTHGDSASYVNIAAHGNYIYVACPYFSKSINGGASFTTSETTLYHMVGNPLQGKVAGVGFSVPALVFSSSNGGSSFTASTDLPASSSLSLGRSGVLYDGAGTGLAISTDGATWTWLNRGFPLGAAVLQVDEDRLVPGRLFSRTSYKLYVYDEPALAAPSNFSATYQGSNHSALTWSPVPGATSYEVVRDFEDVFDAFTSTSTYTDTGAPSGKVMMYAVRAIGNGVKSPWTLDCASSLTFTDDPLVARSTRIKAVHFNELRDAYLQSALHPYGLSSAWTDASLAGQPARSIHLLEIRAAIDRGRAALQLPPVTYTNSITPGSVIRAIDIMETRNSCK